ncbi:MAG: hypothetical protein ACJ796_10580 [Gemmatimonadaceae bacterium]
MPDPEHPRDDAELQPESGYPDGRIPAKPSADLTPERSKQEAQTGSESEFDSEKIDETKSRS